MHESALTEADHELIEMPRRAIDENGDGSTHTMGAAVRDEFDRVHVGVNLFHFTGGPCAELVALAAARTSGAREPKVIVAVGDRNRGVKTPCGRDRQILADYYPNIEVIIDGPNGLRKVEVAALLPSAFDWAAEE